MSAPEETARALPGLVYKGDAAAGALMSLDGVYRYALWRRWREGVRGRVLFIMLNPSTANEASDDNTIRRCRYYASSWGYDGLAVVNLYAYRSTEPRGLGKTLDPIGPATGEVLAAFARSEPFLLCAWGTPGLVRGRAVALHLLAWSGKPLHVLSLTKDGAPHHPLRLPNALPPSPWIEMNRWATA